MRKSITIIIWILSIFIPLLLILNFKSYEVISIKKDTNDSISKIVDSVLLKIELNKKHEQYLELELDSTKQMLKSKNKTKFSSNKSVDIEEVNYLDNSEEVISISDIPKIIQIKIDDNCLEKLKLLELELTRLKIENISLRDSLEIIKDRKIVKKTFRKSSN